MDNAVQPINDSETFMASGNEIDMETSPQTVIATPVDVGRPEQNVNQQQSEVKEDDRPTSATSTTSEKIMETNTDELMDQTLQ